jgi:hypothetical protein
LTETILNKVASRNRDGLITVILSEVRVPSLEDSSELKVINLSNVATKGSTKIPTSSFINGEGNTNSKPVYDN